MAERVVVGGASGLRFDAVVDGPPGGPLVVLLHGFPQTNHTYRREVPALGRAGFRAIAPNQRGYSAGARPDAGDPANYHVDRLVADVLEIADATAGPGASFHLVGHDWGGQVAWRTAMAHPERLLSLTALSRPHPAAFGAAMRDDADQSNRSRHHKAFLDRAIVDRLLADDAARLRQTLLGQGVPADAVNAYLSVLGERAALDAALAWYRAAAGNFGATVGQAMVAVPTLYVWGGDDSSVGRLAAEGTAAHCSGPYRFVELPGVGHFATDQAPEAVCDLIGAHISAIAPDRRAAG